MTIRQMWDALKAAGYETGAEVDRFSVNRLDGKPSTIDVMFTDGNVATIPAFPAETETTEAEA